MPAVGEAASGLKKRAGAQTMTTNLHLELRAKLRERRALPVPGAANALSARIIEDLGFEAVYKTDAWISNTFFGLPDLGFIGATDIVQHTEAIRQAVDLPIVVDADTGFGSLNVHPTVRAVERAGANGIQIEDQVMPKKCRHFSNKEVVGKQEAEQRIRAAAEARRDSDFQIIARTDALAVVALDEAFERAELFIEAGADVIFVEAPENREEIGRIMTRFEAPQVLVLVVGGKAPTISLKDAKAMRCGVVLYANVALQAVAALRRSSAVRVPNRQVDDTTQGIASFEDARPQAIFRQARRALCGRGLRRPGKRQRSAPSADGMYRAQYPLHRFTSGGGSGTP
jgi:2-methylisocitrate lyase-like PEP mutase family enzyme